MKTEYQCFLTNNLRYASESLRATPKQQVRTLPWPEHARSKQKFQKEM